MPKMKMVGVVKSDKTSKTRRVEIPRTKKYPKYGKYVRTRTVCYVHDENNETACGDVVEIENGNLHFFGRLITRIPQMLFHSVVILTAVTPAG